MAVDCCISAWSDDMGWTQQLAHADVEPTLVMDQNISLQNSCYCIAASSNNSPEILMRSMVLQPLV